MSTKTRTALLAITGAVAFAAAAALLPDSIAQGGQFQPSPALLTAEAETTEQDSMMGQGDGGMMDMMNMMQQMSRMMETCNKMMETGLDGEQRPGSGEETEMPQQ